MVSLLRSARRFPRPWMRVRSSQLDETQNRLFALRRTLVCTVYNGAVKQNGRSAPRSGLGA
jgi:hypothetical protein